MGKNTKSTKTEAMTKAEAKAYLQKICKEGGWVSFQEFTDDYLIPYAANRLAALERYNQKKGKTGKAPAKKTSKPAKAKRAAKAVKNDAAPAPVAE